MGYHIASRRGRLVAGVVCVLVVALGDIVPLLEAGDSIDGPAVETEHHAQTCVVVHDCRLCTQIGAAHALIPPSSIPIRLNRSRLGPTPLQVRTPYEPAGVGILLPRGPPFTRV
jgi:hypothetical protein